MSLASSAWIGASIDTSSSLTIDHSTEKQQGTVASCERGSLGVPTIVLRHVINVLGTMQQIEF